MSKRSKYWSTGVRIQHGSGSPIRAWFAEIHFRDRNRGGRVHIGGILRLETSHVDLDLALDTLIERAKELGIDWEGPGTPCISMNFDVRPSDEIKAEVEDAVAAQARRLGWNRVRFDAEIREMRKTERAAKEAAPLLER